MISRRILKTIIAESHIKTLLIIKLLYKNHSYLYYNSSKEKIVKSSKMLLNYVRCIKIFLIHKKM